MFYDNAINRVYGKKRGPHYTTLKKKTIPEGRTSSQTNQRSIFFSAWHCGPQKYDMSISQMPKRVNLSPRGFFIS